MLHQQLTRKLHCYLQEEPVSLQSRPEIKSFAGGTDNSGFSTRTVDIYDAPSNAWTTAQLSEARLDFAGAAAGKKFFLREDTVLPKQ